MKSFKITGYINYGIETIIEAESEEEAIEKFEALDIDEVDNVDSTEHQIEDIFED